MKKVKKKENFDPPPLGFEPQIFEQNFEFWGRLDQ